VKEQRKRERERKRKREREREAMQGRDKTMEGGKEGEKQNKVEDCYGGREGRLEKDRERL
jgi:hypothetical protein